MRYFKVPEPVSLKHPVTKEDVGKTLHFHEFIRGLFQDKKFMKSFKTVSAAQRIDAQPLEKAGEVIAMESSDWDLLKAVIEEPEGGYLGPALQVLSFMQAVLDASETDPRKEAKDG